MEEYIKGARDMLEWFTKGQNQFWKPDTPPYKPLTTDDMVELFIKERIETDKQ